MSNNKATRQETAAESRKAAMPSTETRKTTQPDPDTVSEADVSKAETTGDDQPEAKSAPEAKVSKSDPKPTTSVKLGQVLVYRVPKDEADEHNGLRNTAADKHQGHKIKHGDEVPLIVTALGNDGKFNGQAFLDGNDTLWVKNTTLGDDDGQCTAKG